LLRRSAFYAIFTFKFFSALEGDHMNTSTVIRFMVVAVLCLAADSLTIAQSGGSFTITKSVIAGGGGSASGGSFTVDGTIGQAAAGTISNGGTFSVESGFGQAG